LMMNPMIWIRGTVLVLRLDWRMLLQQKIEERKTRRFSLPSGVSLVIEVEIRGMYSGTLFERIVDRKPILKVS